MASWKNMTAEERESYADKDEVKRSWREDLAVEVGHEHFFELSESSSLADVVCRDTYIPEGMLESIVDPVGLACLKMFHIGGMSRKEISESIVVDWIISGEKVQSSNITDRAVQGKLLKARGAIRKAIGSIEPNPILIEGN